MKEKASFQNRKKDCKGTDAQLYDNQCKPDKNVQISRKINY